MPGEKPKPFGSYGHPTVKTKAVDPRAESASIPPLDDVGVIPSIQPPAPEDALAVANEAKTIAKAALSIAQSLEDARAGDRAGIEAHVDAVVAAKMTKATNDITSTITDHLAAQDFAAAQRNAALDLAALNRDKKFDTLIALVQNKRAVEQQVELEALAIETQRANADQARANAGQARAHTVSIVDENELRGWTKAQKITAVIGSIVVIVGALLGWAGYTQLAHPHGAPAEAEHE